MATENEHRQQAEHNQRFLDSFDHARFPDWCVTVAFYKAVHLVEMLFANKNRSAGSGSHTNRNQILKRHYVSIWRNYRPLYEFSRTARYWCLHAEAKHTPHVLK